jgi:membrane-associated phospholipid phosphatase
MPTRSTTSIPKRATGSSSAKRAALLLLLATARLAAQQAGAVASTPSFKAGRDVLIGGAFIAGAALLSPLDRTVARLSQSPALQSNAELHATATALSRVGAPNVVLALAGATYVGGQLGHDVHAASIGLHGTESVLISDVITGLVKRLAGRARPAVSPDDNDDFQFNGGWSDDNRMSLPSGHATASTAMAAVLAVESNRWWHHAGWVAPTAYSTAGMISLSRIYLDRHWLSDVLAGSGVGLLSGLLVSHFSESHPRNGIDRAFLP